MSTNPSSIVREVGDQVLAAIKSYVSRSLAPLLQRLDAHARRAESTDELLADLERRISELEAKR